MRVLVIGATGYIGRTVCELLGSRGHEVSGLIRPASESRVPANVAAVSGDVTAPESLAAACRESDAVVYCVQYNGEDGFSVESGALRALCGALAPAGKRLLYTSGVWMYGNNYPQIATEETPPNPIAIVAKRPDLERIVIDAAKDGVHSVIIRPGDVYGRGGGIPAMWVQSARDEGAARVIGDGNNHWPMIHIDDLAVLFALALERAAAGSAYIAVDDTQLTVNAMAEAASRGAGKGGAVTHWPLEEARKAMGAFADALAIDQAATSAKARRELSWTTRASTAIDDLASGSYVRA